MIKDRMCSRFSFKVFFSLYLLLLQYNGSAQSCSCNGGYKLALFDFDVQVPQPADKTMWADWQGLFRIAGHVAGKIGNQDKCIKNRLVLTYSKGDDQRYKFGPGFANLPSNPHIGANLSDYGQYLFTGVIKLAGADYQIIAEVQGSCNRKVVAKATITVPAANVGNIDDIAAKLADQLLPLSTKIQNYEVKERETNKNVAFNSGFADGEIIITPKKRNVAAGEQTEIEILLRDCDGAVLPNREVVFVQGSIPETGTLEGTTGGTVIPERVITDAAGKAKAIFKMGSGRSATINAHLIHKTPNGCQFAKLGSTPIGNIPYKIEIVHENDEVQQQEMFSIGEKKKVGEWVKKQKMFHKSVLYHYPSPVEQNNEQVLFSTDQGTTQHLLETGNFFWEEKRKFEGEAETSQKITGVANIKYPSVAMLFLGNDIDPTKFIWSVEYPASDDATATGTMELDKCDPRVQWKINTIADPNSPYKTEYLLTINIDVAQDLKESVESTKKNMGMDFSGITNGELSKVVASGYRDLTVRILSPYPPAKFAVCK
jgi:hypothetical protein